MLIVSTSIVLSRRTWLLDAHVILKKLWVSFYYFLFVCDFKYLLYLFYNVDFTDRMSCLNEYMGAQKSRKSDGRTVNDVLLNGAE
jgi:hypothetical protein